MNAQMVLSMGQEALLTLLMVAAPILGIVLVVGPGWHWPLPVPGC